MKRSLNQKSWAEGADSFNRDINIGSQYVYETYNRNNKKVRLALAIADLSCFV